uniref:Senescence-associated protein SPA15, chloroplastic n=1 Tax=Noccaea caerulescens TaxID=107243 RepID=A0A1J3H3G2_NOCCA
MALNVSKVVPNGPVLAKRVNVNTSRSQIVLLAFSPKKSSSAEELQVLCCTKPVTFVTSRRSSTLCFLGKSQDTETKPHEDCLDLPNSQIVQKEGEKKQVMPRRTSSSSQVLVEYVSNDAKFVNERARNDFVLLSRGIMRLDARARQDVAILGSGFLKLDARAREDTEKIDRDVKRKAERLHHIATILKNIAQSKLKNAADKHWSDGALEADLRRADFRAKQRAMEDALMALEFIKNVHDMMVNKMVNSLGVTSETGITDRISLEKNGKALDFFPGEVSSDRISAIEEAYRGMTSALSEADGIDYTDPEELELLVTTLIDLDAMDGKTSASLLAECSSSPDVNTRKALANALAAAPSMWTLGNAGMGALQRLAEDSNPAIAAAASKAIIALKKQWEVEEGDSLRFMMNLEKPNDDDDEDEYSDHEEI